MKKYFIYLISLLTISFSCCGRKVKIQERNLLNFPSVFSLNGEAIELNDSIYFPKACGIIDSLFFIFDMKNDHFLRIYDINNFKLIKKYGSIGRGPGEYIRPNTNDLQFSTIGNKGIWITDFKFKIFIDIDSVINKENYIPSKRIPLLPEFGPINYLYKVSDYLMVGNSSLYKNGQLFFWDPSQDTYLKKSYYPTILKDIPKTQSYLIPQIYFGLVKVSDVIVIAYNYFKIIDIIALNGQHMFRIYFQDKEIPKMKISNRSISTKDCTYYFSCVQMTNKYIYALCWDISNRDIGTNNSKFPKIYVLDRKGNPVSIFLLDKPISTFCIFEKENVIFGINPNNDLKVPLIRYKIPVEVF